MPETTWAAIILAAGRSTRFKPGHHKLVTPVLERPVIGWTVARCHEAGAHPIVVVVDDPTGPVARCIHTPVPSLRWAVQREAKGTGDAVLQARHALEGYTGLVVILNGDTPAVRSETIQTLVNRHRETNAAFTFATGYLSDPNGYGRVVRDRTGCVQAIRETLTGHSEGTGPAEVNLGIYVAEWPTLVPHLASLVPHPEKQEIFLTDVVERLVVSGLRVEAVVLPGPDEALGINTWEDLHVVQEVLRRQIVQDWIHRGVRFLDPARVWIGAEVEIGADTVLYPDVTLEGRTRIGHRCVLYPGVRIRDSQIGADTVIGDHTVIEDSQIGDRCRVGPMARLRPGTVLDTDVRIGNFVELKKTRVGTGTKAMHLTYLGDAVIGQGVNVGAGTITCNYDGVQKHTTVIEDGAFIGSDVQLIAPVRVGQGAYVAAGSTITRDVPPKSLGIARARQENKRGWVARWLRRRSRVSKS